jgi:hypothetical protein
MTIKPEDIEVPEWLKGLYFNHGLREILAALANNPIVPTEQDTDEIVAEWSSRRRDEKDGLAVFVCTEWQRRMFLRKRNPELDALLESAPRVARYAVLAAYEMGKAERK